MVFALYVDMIIVFVVFGSMCLFFDEVVLNCLLYGWF